MPENEKVGLNHYFSATLRRWDEKNEESMKGDFLFALNLKIYTPSQWGRAMNVNVLYYVCV